GAQCGGSPNGGGHGGPPLPPRGGAGGAGWGAVGRRPPLFRGARPKSASHAHTDPLGAGGRGVNGPTRSWTAARSHLAAARAASPGYAVAGGLELALWCDLRVMEANATLGVFCRRWGVPLVDGGTVRLPRLIGLGRALDLILTGRPVGAEEALAMGLVNRVV